MSDTEERARAMGWVPQEEFRGDPEKWRTAEEFLEIGLNYMPVLKERLIKMEQDLADKTARLERTTQNLSKFAEFHKGTYKRAYAKAKAEIEDKRRAAAQQGDIETYDLLGKEAEAIDQEAALLEQEQMGDAGGQVLSETFNQWHEKNTWYMGDQDLTLYADGLAQSIRESGFAGSEAAFYAEIERRVKATFPHKFVNLNQEKPPAVEGAGGPAGEKKSKKKTFSDIPQEDRAQYEKHFKEICSKEDYAKDYWAQFEEE